jgi:hypothetical protein
MNGRGLCNVGLNVFTHNTYTDLASYDAAWGKCLDESRITDTIFRRTWVTDLGLIISSNIIPTSLLEIA